jgi:hypothetical protein
MLLCYRLQIEQLAKMLGVLTLEPFGVLAPESRSRYTGIRRGGMMTKLPKILEREPLVDAVFEVRLGGDPHMSANYPAPSGCRDTAAYQGK